jgi:hypothetical protein
MGKYDQFVDGYAQETTFRDGTTIDGVGDTAYLWGAVSQESVHPSPTTSINYPATGVNTKEVGAGLLWKSFFELRGMYGLRMQNGILCWAAMGVSSTAGTDPYTHTIGPTTDGSQLPSFVINHERKGDATDEEYQFLGCKIDSLMLYHDLSDKAGFLMAKVEWMAGEAQDGIALTTTPALPATANTASYTQLTRTWYDTPEFAGAISLEGLAEIEIHIINGLAPVRGHTWDAGTYTGRWVQEFLENPRKQYLVNMKLHQNTIERVLWDELIATDNTKNAIFKWTRSANDYIQVTCTDCQVIQHDIKTPPVGETLFEQVVLEPRALAIEVKDSIAGARYGE